MIIFTEASEDESQINVFKWAAAVEAMYPCLEWLYHTPNGGSRNKYEAIKLKRMGVKPGVSDIYLPCHFGGYHGLYIEMKHGKNKPTDRQKEFITFVRKQGYRAVVCRSSGEAIDEIENYINGRIKIDDKTI